MAGFRYKAFISYSWSDRRWGEWLHRALETYRTPSALVGKASPLGPVPRTLHPIFKDREEVAAGISLGATLEAALNDSEFLIVICSPRAAKSKWLNREIAWFKIHRDPAKILALIIDGEPGASAIAGREAQECFPPALVHKVNADLTVTGEREDEPLGADVRNSGDGKNLAKLKIIAAMLGVGLDELVKRDERRRSFRRRLVTSGALVLAAAMSGLAYTAMLARDEARFQRDEAQGLIEFMLTDLRKRLDAVGRLDVLESVGERALKYFSAQDLSSLDANALGRRARALLLVGEIANLRGDNEAALAAYKQAAATTAEQLRRNPNSAQQIFDHAQSVFWVGYIAWQRRDLATARKNFQEYHNLAKRLVVIDPNKDEWQSELVYAYSNLGALELDEGNAAAAEVQFRNSLAVVARLARKHPQDVNRLMEEGNQRAWLADALFLGLKFNDARTQRLAEIALYEHGFTLSPGNKILQERSVVAHDVLGTVELAMGNLEGVLLHAKFASDLSDRLIASDPDNTRWAEFGTNAHVTHGEVLVHIHDYGQARTVLSKAVSMGSALIAKDGKVIRWKRILAQAQLLLARAIAEEGDAQRARELVLAVKDILEHLLKTNTSDRILFRHYCEALAMLSRAQANLAGSWPEIVGRLEPHSVSGDAKILTLLAEAYLRTSRVDQARQVAQRLNDAGYRHPDFLALIANTPNLIAISNEAVPPANSNR